MNCIVCGIEIIGKRNDAKYCNDCAKEMRKASYRKYYYNNQEKRINESVAYVRLHGRKPRHVVHSEKMCIYCGEVFIPKRSDQESCGKRDAVHRKTEKVKKIQCVCPICGKIFFKRVGDYNRSMMKFGYTICSTKCANIKSGNSIKITCSECGKVFYRKKSGIDSNNNHFFCSKKCQKENIEYILRGENHYRYIDGNPNGKRGIGWTKLRKVIRARDNYTCQVCGKTEIELKRALDVHHIKPYRLFDNFKEANKEDNLISLCASCHHKLDAQLQ